MADSSEWFVGEDGCLSLGQQSEVVTYHPNLNAILVTTKEPALRVLDVTSGSLLQTSNLSAGDAKHIDIRYLPNQDRVLFSSNNAVSVRKDFNGILLLDTALQVPVSRTEDTVTVELPLPEANQLLKCMMSAELSGVDYVEDVIRELEKDVERAQQAAKVNHKVAKWASVCITLSHCAIKTVCSGLVQELKLQELKRLHQNVPGLSVASAVADRLNYLLTTGGAGGGGQGMEAGAPVERSLMYSEAARLDTFIKWPHMDYKWALPEPMAQAGFYHQPSSTGDDRAMCFTCNVCLVCWEPTDEPWSEHERHSPNCPFVKGEYTQNVPMSVTYATEPGHSHGESQGQIECVSTTSSKDIFATSGLHGNVVVWNMGKRLVSQAQFNIDPWDAVVASAIGTHWTAYSDGSIQPATSNTPHTTGFSEKASPQDASVDTEAEAQGKAEVIEVGGAWKMQTDVGVIGEIVEIPLSTNSHSEHSFTHHRCRPSQDVLVSSLCVLGTPLSSKPPSKALATAPKTTDPTKRFSSLIAGVTIRKHSLSVSGGGRSLGEDNMQSEVEALNEVNQALSSGESTPQIIDPMGQTTPSSHFHPYLLVHDLGSSNGQSQGESRKNWKQSNSSGKLKDTAVNYSMASSSSNKVLQDIYMSPNILGEDEEEDDMDVKIIGVTHPDMEVSEAPGSKFSALSSKSIGLSMSSGHGSSDQEVTGKNGNTASRDNIQSSDAVGKVIQCLELPSQVSNDQCVTHIVPTADGTHVVVITSPRSLSASLSSICTVDSPGSSSEETSGQQTGVGAIILYKVTTSQATHLPVLDTTPSVIHTIESVDDCVKSVTMLPIELAHIPEDDDMLGMLFGAEGKHAGGLEGQMVVTTCKGHIQIMDLASLKHRACISPPDKDRFVSSVFCTGIDRLCCLSAEGRLQFYFVGPRRWHLEEDHIDGCSIKKTSLTSLQGEEHADLSSVHSGEIKTEELLVQQHPLTTPSLMTLHDLTQFESVVPRFSATMPPCWSEIQQEQQQRRHPQHLHQQGDASQTTRTWRLQPDSSSWEEHLFELVLPRSCSVGHIDLKFSLHPLCTTPPNIQITLLKQSIASLGRGIPPLVSSPEATEVKMEEDGGDSLPEESASSSKMSNHDEDVICGPVDISNFVDLSGHGGIVTLTSTQLLKYKARSFLLHLKATPNDKSQKTPTTSEKPPTDKSTVSSAPVNTAASSSGSKTIAEHFTSMAAGGGPASLGGSSLGVSKQKLDNVRGCDWLQELSITVRRCKKTALNRDRAQRVAMLETPGFHAQLVCIACGNEGANGDVTQEHRQRLALAILIWVLAIHTNMPHPKLEEGCMLTTIQTSLKQLVCSCFMQSGRSTAHQCAKLLTMCIEFTKLCRDIDVAPSFSLALLHALLDALPHVGVAQSSGALYWYFTMLNRVKCMDVERTSQHCADILLQVASSYHSRHNPQHAVLRAKFGLYGTPLEPELFDIDLPVSAVSSTPPSTLNNNTVTSAKPLSSTNTATNSFLFGSSPVLQSAYSSNLPSSYADVLGAGTGAASSSASAHSTGCDTSDFSDLIGLVSGEKGRKVGSDVWRHLHGLLEVEPLHFTCHATSDGTRMERLDTASSMGVGSHVGSTNLPASSAGESLSSAAGAALASLSTAMASSDNQLTSLQHKQMQLLKLQQQKYKLEQKLAETSKSAATSAMYSSPAVQFYSSELMPPTPKNTPFFMTPPVTPPNEALYHNVVLQGTEPDPGKPPTGKTSPTKSGGETPVGQGGNHKGSVVWPYTHQLFHPPPPQALVIERMHAGARRFVVLDFQHPVLLTDIIIPACTDLASISIDIWVSGEETDGQRLVVSSDIGLRSLFMNDIMPPPICRYLKITTIGRYGGSTTRSKIPIGSFFGHTFILPWEMPMAPVESSTASALNSPSESSSQSSVDQAAIFSQLSCYVSLLEDIECRYSLACNRLSSLLENHLEGASSQPGYSARRGGGKQQDSTRTVQQAYTDCVQLQLQYNLAHKAIERLHKVLGLQPRKRSEGTVDLKKVATDKLRVLSELLLDTLLSMTVPSPSIPQMPVSLYTILTPHACQVLFTHLCIAGGTRKSQLHTGVLLARVCGQQAWWGDFLGNILQEFFSARQDLVFPQDRVFVLVTALGQKALSGGTSAGEVLEAVLMLLARLLAPLLTPTSSQQHYASTRPRTAASLDLSLVGWILLFLSKCLDSIQPASDEMDKSREKDGGSSSRWDFLQGESALQSSRSTKSAVASKLYRRKLQKRLMHHKQQLLDLQMAKKKFLLAQAEKAALAASGGTKEATEHMMKTQEMMFKKQFKQFSSKHFKDLINIRRTDGELLKKAPKDSGASANGSANGASNDADSSSSGDGDGAVVVAREKCIPVVRGLMALLLSMDFTCHVDLFIISCKVIARIAGLARPCVGLWEVMRQEELEHLLLLTCNTQYNLGNVNWGGAWAPHSIICLLQDILDGEKLYSTLSVDAMDEEMEHVSSVAMETDEALQAQAESANKSSGSEAAAPKDALPAQASSSSINNAGPPTSASSTATGGTGFPFDKESSIMVDMLLEDEYFDDVAGKDYVAGDMHPPFTSGAVGDKSSPWYWVPPPPVSSSAGGAGTINWSSTNSTGVDAKKLHLKAWKTKLHSYVSSKSSSSLPQGVSTAMDARLENGVELTAELRLRVMLSLEEESIQTALSSSLPPLAACVGSLTAQSHYPSTDDEQLTDASLLQSTTHSSQEVVPSSQMLSTCFNQLFMQLEGGRVNLDSLLHAWLTLSEEPPADDTTAPSQTNGGGAGATSSTFDPTLIPTIPLSSVAVTALLNTLAHSHITNTGSWVLAFQTLSLLCNQRSADERWLAAVMVSSESLMHALTQFLSIVPLQGSAPISHHFTQIGPTAVKSFYEFLVRVQLRCAEDRESHWKELLLRLVYSLTADRGAFSSSVGPLDAQCKLLEYMLDQTYDTVDVNNAISVVEAVVGLVRQYISAQDNTQCRSSTDSSMSARSCFGGLLANILRGSDASNTSQATRDLLMCNLLKLVNLMLQINMPGGRNEVSGRGSVEISPAMDSQSRTDEQKQESVSAAAAGSGSHSNGGSCNTPLSRTMVKCTHVNTRESSRRTTLCDVILSHVSIMKQLLESLSWCNSNTMAMILGSSGLPLTQDSAPVEPLSVGDGIFQILCTLNRMATSISLVLKPLHAYLSSVHQQGMRMAGICRLSEPLLWFILRVLDCDVANKTFLDMGGVSVICNNLVQSNRQLINTSPSLVTTIMQYLVAVRPQSNTSPASAVKKLAPDIGENSDGLQNFAPLGTISSSSPTAGPADVLIQSSPPHRRARSAAWSYHFYPDEAWVDLSISLPCAVLLQEVHIQPHLTSLATCPAAVSIEVSQDHSPPVPISAPVLTSGLSAIKINLLKPEIVTSVTLRFHKPRDSQTLGLSQISLLGFTAFGDTGALKASSVLAPQEDYVSRTSIGWLRLLHHCLSQSEELQLAVSQAASHTSHLLPTCTSLLLSPSATLYATNIEAVLLKIGLHSPRMGLSLIDQLLRNSTSSPHGDMAGPMLQQHGRLCGVANESTIDILFQLGMNQDPATQARMKTLTDWLGDSARVALQKTHSKPQENYRMFPWQQGSPDLPPPAAAHVHCLAAILWKSHELPAVYNMANIITNDLLSSMYEWAMLLPVRSPLKRAVDYVICSMCYINSKHFATLLEWMGIVVNVDITSVTDDYKDTHQISLTDDSKADNEARGRQPISSEGVGPVGGAFQPLVLQEFGHMMLDEQHLSTLAVACQSPEALRQLLESGFVAVLCQGLYEFCMREMLRYSESLLPAEAESGASSRTASTSSESSRRARTSSESSHSDKMLCVTVDLVAPVLHFLAEVAQEVEMKNWLAGPEGSAFWPVLLRLLCGTPAHSISALHAPFSLPEQHKVMTSPQRSAIETATVKFFSSVLACHPQSQTQFATMLCDVIRGNGHMLNSSPLSGFMRRLFLQVLLEDEKILVAFSSSAPVYKGTVTSMSPSNQHPRCGAGHKFRSILLSMQTTCGEALSRVSDTPSLSVHVPEASSDKSSKEEKKDTTQLGLEVADQISAAAGLQAKEKRDKSKGALVRPPTRRGNRQPDPTSMIHLPSMALFHSLIPGQTLPPDLSLSQLLVLLQQRGFPSGQASLQFNMRLNNNNGKNKNARDEEDEISEPIPVDILLDTPSFPSALQVFASVGGLALLAEHLPLLYPEVTRQVAPSDSSEKHSGMGGGYDWVTVESAEDIYEDFDEPMPSGPQLKQQSLAPAVPSIPPHSLVAFGLFLRLPGYAEVLLREKRQAQCLLRLVLGVTHDGDGGHILSAPRASSLQTLPFTVLKTLFDSTPLSTDDGVLLRRMSLEIGAVHLILACLSVLSHHAPRQPIPGFHQEIIQSATQAASALSGRNGSNGGGVPPGKPPAVDEKPPVVSQSMQPQCQQHYWAKGTGFGTGSTTSSWDAEQALLRQRSEEQHVTCLLEVLASYINPGDQAHMDHIGLTEGSTSLPNMLPELLSQSCLVPAISSYLRNDSVLDMARHVPLYRALLELLRGLAACWPLVPLLLPLKDNSSSSGDPPTSIVLLLDKMRMCVDTYANRLKGQQKTRNGSSTNKAEDEESEGLALLIPDIQRTDSMVDAAVERLKQRSVVSEDDQQPGMLEAICRMNPSQEERYMGIMKKLQFDTYELVREDENGGLVFAVPHHYESQVKAVGEVNNASRARRLAQEAVTLSTSLPLSPSSSVFVRCDEDRLDLMKVLITAPSDTPYANGCFEFDVYFPPDYPNSPPLINLQTTGNQTVRFNPNLYNDGKVCLSILNTWHGRPEEKWNSQTSSFLQVLVSIQSLILVSEPYFNEPGYERSRGTRAGNASSKEYDAIIRHATVKWAMLEMLRNPVSCFKDVIERHFWLKKHEIMAEVEAWILDLEANSSDKRVGRTISHSCVALKRYYKQLAEEFAKMKPPADLAVDEDDSWPMLAAGDEASTSLHTMTTSSATQDLNDPTSSLTPSPLAPPTTIPDSAPPQPNPAPSTSLTNAHVPLVSIPPPLFNLSKLPPIDTSMYAEQLMSMSSSDTSGSSSEEQPFDSSEDQGAMSSAAEDMVAAIVGDNDNESISKPPPSS